jgi:hypothetical protein
MTTSTSSCVGKIGTWVERWIDPAGVHTPKIVVMKDGQETLPREKLLKLMQMYPGHGLFTYDSKHFIPMKNHFKSEGYLLHSIISIRSI